MRFQVPQFTETETKLIGPFTLTQFLYVGAGGAIVFILQFVLSGFWFLFAGFIIGGIALGLAFLKIDGISLPRWIVIALSFMAGEKKFVFRAEERESYLPESVEGLLKKK